MQGLGWERREGGVKSLKKQTIKKNKEEKEGKGKEKEQKLAVVI